MFGSCSRNSSARQFGKLKKADQLVLSQAHASVCLGCTTVCGETCCVRKELAMSGCVNQKFKRDGFKEWLQSRVFRARLFLHRKSEARPSWFGSQGSDVAMRHASCQMWLSRCDRARPEIYYSPALMQKAGKQDHACMGRFENSLTQLCCGT